MKGALLTLSLITVVASSTEVRAGEPAPPCAELAAQHAADKTATALVALAECNAANGKTATAWDEYQRAAGLAHSEGNEALSTQVRAKVSELESKLTRLKLELAPGAKQDGMIVTISGDPIDLATLGVALALDPGQYEVEASAPGYAVWKTVVPLQEPGKTVTVTIPVFQRRAPEPTAPPPAPMPQPPMMPPPQMLPRPLPSRDTGGTEPLWPMVIAGFSLAGVGVIVGAITGGVALGKGGDVKDQCNGDACPPSQADALDEATTLANVSNAMFVIAGVGVVVGVIGLFVPAGDSGVEVGFDAGQLSLRGAF